MTETEKLQYEALMEEVRHHEYLYYVLDEPTLSDAAYDALYQSLQAFEKAHPNDIAADTPTCGGRCGSRL